ncbi:MULTISPECIES: MFS transporter [unclassified Streptomyces]|uniref:MFS transporter n=1 Tax=unclassified Streptomyces TaxID=2593676 RepID=UPI001652DF63|nr:MFS transporter [Streptomyces sp. sk2.1]
MPETTPSAAEAAPPAQSPPARVPWAAYTGVYLLLFLIGTETFLVSPLLPTIAGSVGVSVAAAASTVTAYTLVYALTAPFLGAVSDRFGRRPTILAGTLLFLLGNALAAVAGNLTVLVVARVVGALGAALAGPSIWAHIAETAPAPVRGRAVGLGMALFSAGQVLGVPAGSFLAGWGGWRASFWALTALTAASAPLLLAQIERRPKDGAAGGAAPLRFTAVFSVWRDGVLRHTLIVVFLLQAANLGAYTFLGSALHDRFGLSVNELGLLGILVGAGSALGSLVAGRIGDRARERGSGDAVWIPVWCLVLGGAAVLAALGATSLLAYAAVLVWFFASGAFGTLVQTLLVSSRPDLGATSSSWNSATLYAGTAVGVAAAGAFAHADTGTAVVGGGLAVLAGLTALPLVGRLRPAGAQGSGESAAPEGPGGPESGKSAAPEEPAPEGTSRAGAVGEGSAKGAVTDGRA